MTALVIVKPAREKPILNQHPWVFSGAVDSILGDPKPGDIVTLVSRDRRFLARGYFNPKSQIVVRILTWQDEEIDEAWWRRMLQRAIDVRKSEHMHGMKFISAARLVNAENDFIPGLVVDRYADWLVVQALTLGIDQRKDMIVRLLAELVEPKGIYERSDVDVRGKEGLKPSNGLLSGDEPPEHITISEYSATYLIDVRNGHKTGFYLDQRENRKRLADIIYDVFSVSDKPIHRILNLFSYTGGFGLAASYAESNGGGVTLAVTNVDASHEALELAEKNFQHNNLPLDNVEFIQANVFDYLRDMNEAGEQYDVIVLDPPKFAQNAQQVDKAARGYKDLNLYAFRCVAPGGFLMTFSCSGAITPDLFQKIVFGALADSGRQAQILRHLGPGDDHPVALTFPEGAYLKGLLLRVY